MKPLRCIQIWIVICYRGLRFPQESVFLMGDDLQRYWPPEHGIKQWYESLQVIVASARSVGWGSKEAVVPVSCTLSKCFGVQYGNTIDSTHRPYSPFTQHVTVCFLYCISVLWALCQAVILLTYVVSTNIGSCKLVPWYIIHILGFITPNFFLTCLMIMEGLGIYQAWIWVWLSNF